MLLHWNFSVKGFVIRQFWIQDGLKVDPKNVVSKQKCAANIEKMTIFVGYNTVV